MTITFFELNLLNYIIGSRDFTNFRKFPELSTYTLNREIFNFGFEGIGLSMYQILKPRVRNMLGCGSRTLMDTLFFINIEDEPVTCLQNKCMSLNKLTSVNG